MLTGEDDPRPFWDGSEKDKKRIMSEIRERRESLSGAKAVDIILQYLRDQKYVLEKDLERDKDLSVGERRVTEANLIFVKQHLRWIEATIIWINYNV